MAPNRLDISTYLQHFMAVLSATFDALFTRPTTTTVYSTHKADSFCAGISVAYIKN